MLTLQNKKRGGGGFSQAERGGGTKGFGVVLTQVLEVLVMFRGWLKKFPLFKKKSNTKQHFVYEQRPLSSTLLV